MELMIAENRVVLGRTEHRENLSELHLGHSATASPGETNEECVVDER